MVCLFFFVFLILFFANSSQVANPVVSWNSVYVVNVLWKIAINIKPSKPVSKIELIVNVDSEVSIFVKVSSLCASVTFSTSYLIDENSNFMVVVKQLF